MPSTRKMIDKPIKVFVLFLFFPKQKPGLLNSHTTFLLKRGIVKASNPTYLDQQIEGFYNSSKPQVSNQRDI